MKFLCKMNMHDWSMWGKLSKNVSFLKRVCFACEEVEYKTESGKKIRP